MPALTYPNLIVQDRTYKALADLSLHFPRDRLNLLLTAAIDAMPKATLEFYAEKWSLLGADGWGFAQTERQQRNLLRQAVFLHRQKGTPASLKNLIRTLGYGEVDIIERLGEQENWNHYSVKFKQPLTIRESVFIRQALQYFAPARCILDALDFTETTLLHNGFLQQRLGLYTRGAVTNTQ